MKAKSLIAIGLLAIVAGCSSMGIDDRTSGSSGESADMSARSGSGQDPFRNDNLFYSWID